MSILRNLWFVTGLSAAGCAMSAPSENIANGEVSALETKPAAAAENSDPFTRECTGIPLEGNAARDYVNDPNFDYVIKPIDGMPKGKVETHARFRVCTGSGCGEWVRDENIADTPQYLSIIRGYLSRASSKYETLYQLTFQDGSPLMACRVDGFCYGDPLGISRAGQWFSNEPYGGYVHATSWMKPGKDCLAGKFEARRRIEGGGYEEADIRVFATIPAPPRKCPRLTYGHDGECLRPGDCTPNAWPHLDSTCGADLCFHEGPDCH